MVVATPADSQETFDTTELATLRTKAALDRTLLAWIRTAFALDSFGFALASYVAKWVATGALHDVQPQTPRQLGVTLLATGTIGLIGGSVEYAGAMRRLRRAGRIPRASVSFAIAGLMIAVSTLMLLGALLKAGPF